MFSLGVGEIVVIVFVLVLLFGAKRIPQVAKSLVDTLRELRRVGEIAEES